MAVRKASMGDVGEIARNNVILAIESENTEIEYEKTLKGVAAVIEDEKKGFYLVAEEGGGIVGQLMVTYEWSDWRGADIWWLQSVYVRKEWRRKGVMKALVDEVKRMALKKGVCSLHLYVHHHNENAIRAYEKIGMKKHPYHIFSEDLQEPKG